jgi:UDP-N-acetylmuramyl pentapeptide phosphotransferase/UDP-N-acetylglucosamine-1-phosphate transferase
MAWQYLTVCLFDFMLAPILLGVYSALFGGEWHNWDPLTIRGGAVYHLAMGAVVGVTVWSRGQEKLQWLNNDGDNKPCDENGNPRKD